MDEEVQRRFWSKVEKTDGCWTWTGYGTSGGYGQIMVSGRNEYAHRISYRLHRGEVPNGLQIDHLCRNRRCVNPAHLEAVTQRENLLRGEGVTAQLARQTHCKRGHPLSESNLRLNSRGHRLCVTCADAATEARYQAQAEERKRQGKPGVGQYVRTLKTHCKNGHDMSVWGRRNSTRRYCLACREAHDEGRERHGKRTTPCNQQ